jgi:hypothetical protein
MLLRDTFILAIGHQQHVLLSQDHARTLKKARHVLIIEQEFMPGLDKARVLEEPLLGCLQFPMTTKELVELVHEV